MNLSRRNAIVGALALTSAGLTAAALRWTRRPFPSDQTPRGAYLRIAISVSNDDPKAFFAYLETEAQWACYTLRDARKSALELIQTHYPESKRAEHIRTFLPIATCADGSDVFSLLYREKHWDRRLRRDLSGVAHEEFDTAKERASIVTVRGTRWPFRKRDNGIWGITIFTAELAAESEKASRDLAVIKASAEDYQRRNAHL